MFLLVTMHVYSGVPDPSWALSEEQSSEFLDRVQFLSEETSVKALRAFPRLGYRGFSVSSSPDAAFGDIRIEVNDGIVDLGHGVASLFDKERSLEKWLLDTGGDLIVPATRDAVEGALRTPAEEAISSHEALLYRAPSRSCSPNALDAPAYRPRLWYDRNTRLYNNCYNYANNKITGVSPTTAAQPGKAHGALINGKTCPDLIAAVQADGLVLKPDFASPLGANQGWYVALVINPGVDYHFYRQDADGCWSHKIGRAPVTGGDHLGNVITDPRTCRRGDYTQFCGFAVTNRSVVIA